MKAADIRRVGENEFLITWEDGHRSLYMGRYLRFHCPCAGCVDEMSGVRKLQWNSVKEDTRALEMDAVGNYAVRFKWSDGHQTGIYSFDYLRKICPCESCSSKILKEIA